MNMTYRYKEYEGLIFRISTAANIMHHHVELYRRGIGFSAFQYPTMILMRGYDISENEAKRIISQFILQR
jgi:Tfp pilus assembly PilM family ATPase